MPILVVIYSIQLIYEVGIFVCIVPIIVAISLYIDHRLQEWYLVTISARGVETDKKNKLTEESIKGIKMVKLNAWEEVVRIAIFKFR